MRSGGGLLAAVVVLAWAAVYVVTQILTNPPLSPGRLVLAGSALSALLIVGYPSALRGPRVGRRIRRSGLRPTVRGGDTSVPMAAMSQRIPLRSGLTAEAAGRTVRLLHPLIGGDAVAITDRERVLAFVGPGDDHHGIGRPPVASTAAGAVLEDGRTLVLRGGTGQWCADPRCLLESVAVAPLVIGKQVVGTLEVYRRQLDPPSQDVVEGLARILSLHLELAELDRERQLAADAKLDALRAQINPHFLFNTLNTIASRARTDPEEARRLLLRLSDFFRYSIRQDDHFADFAQEYFFVRTYLSLEQARFGDRLHARYDVDPQVLSARVPVLTIQPLVENAVKHGLAEKVGGGTVTLRARVDPLTRTTMIQVRDDGVGMETRTLSEVLAGAEPGGGIGLRNISERMGSLFGPRYELDVRSKPGRGTTVDLRIPLQ